MPSRHMHSLQRGPGVRVNIVHRRALSEASSSSSAYIYALSEWAGIGIVMMQAHWVQDDNQLFFSTSWASHTHSLNRKAGMLLSKKKLTKTQQPITQPAS